MAKVRTVRYDPKDTSVAAQRQRDQTRYCIGVLGRLFGHKFTKHMGDYVVRGEFCFRCGMPEGGWRT